jgi:phosphoribosylformylglycinamidine cyclo-ligase
MVRTFNNGIGMIAIVLESSAQEMLEQLSAMKEKGFIIGEIIERKESAQRVEWV